MKDVKGGLSCLRVLKDMSGEMVFVINAFRLRVQNKQYYRYMMRV